MEMIPVASVLKFLLNFLPAFLLKRYYTAARLARLIYVDMQPRQESARVNLASAASFDVWLQIINLSPFEVELDRATVRLSCGSAPLQASVHTRQTIKPGESTSIGFTAPILDGYADQIAKNIGSRVGWLDGNIEFNCRVRSFARPIPSLAGVQLSFINERPRIETAA